MKSCGSCGSKTEKLTPSHDCKYRLCFDCVKAECWDCGSYYSEISEFRHLCIECQNAFDYFEEKINQ